jgi:hypothetical protein
MSRFTPGILIVLLVLLVACESSGHDNPFGFTIPDDIETTDGALDYVREREDMKPGELINNDEIRLSAHVGGVPELPWFYDIIVKIVAKTETTEDAVRIQKKWEGYLQRLFEPIGICGTTKDPNDKDPQRPIVIDWLAWVGPEREETYLPPCPG